VPKRQPEQTRENVQKSSHNWFRFCQIEKTACLLGLIELALEHYFVRLSTHSKIQIQSLSFFVAAVKSTPILGLSACQKLNQVRRVEGVT